MMFHTAPFILGFLPLCLIGYFRMGRWFGADAALAFLVAASLAFYAYWNPLHVPLLLASVVANYAIAWRMRGSRFAKSWLTGGVVLNLALLGWFKYADFLLHTVRPEAPHLLIALPLAISFFTFQQIMFLVDTGRPGAPLPRPMAYLAFVSFFPHLIAGPIVRPAEILPQLTDPNAARVDWGNVGAGCLIFLLGLGKKLVLADLFGGFASVGFDAAARGTVLSFFEAWYAVLAYALQIYFDFSAYSDMAMGLARMLNVRFPLNFDSPYQARDIAAFWRRWHITLGGFLRDYLYVPLGGNRSGVVRHCLNLLVTMLLAGLWHGAAWNFVVWGGLHGVYLVIHRTVSMWRIRLPRPIPHCLTLLAVIVAWVPFRADSVAATQALLAGMAGLHGVDLPRMIITSLPVLSIFAQPVAVLPSLGDARTLSFPEVSACLLLGWSIVLFVPNVQQMTQRMRQWTLTASFAFSVQALFFAPHVAPFLYFRF
jgi:alginate O-acetyltransferase complex protein AlgI